MSAKYKDVLYRVEKQIVDNTSGEVQEETTVRRIRVQREPEFVKMYLNDLMYISNMPIKGGTTAGRLAVLFELVKLMKYGTNQVAVSTGERRKIAAALELHDLTVQRYISDFQKAKIMIKEDVGLYTMNPHFFAKGEWKEIGQMKMNIKFDFNKLERTVTIG